jgi:hypothetical protein
MQDPNLKVGYYGIAPEIHETIFMKTGRGFATMEALVYSRMAIQQHKEGKFDGIRFEYEPGTKDDPLLTIPY